jgi:hypothetical protein
MNDKSHLFDVRVRERNIKRGLIEAKDVEKYLSELPDQAEQAEIITQPQPALDGDDDLDDDGDDDSDD